MAAPTVGLGTAEMDVYFRYHDAHLWCENLPLARLKDEINSVCNWPGPIVVYSKAQLLANVRRYFTALSAASRSSEGRFKYRLGYSLKANAAPALLRAISAEGTFAVTVSANEIEFALRCGFPAETLVFNGNGKQPWELEVAAGHGCMVNVDAIFDIRVLAREAERLNRTIDVLIRLNPNVETGAHPFNATGAPQSKFGVERPQLDGVLNELEQHGSRLRLVGLHCHIGSNVANPDLFVGAAMLLLEEAGRLRQGGRFPDLTLINLGGGWGIDYLHVVGHPDPAALVEALTPLFDDGKFTLMLEPGRSIVGPAGMVVTDVIGLKSNGGRQFVVVNAAMTEVIRPALYGAHHHISLVDTEATSGKEEEIFDVVGPVCESGDFLAKDRRLLRPLPASLLAVWDTGAYCSATSSNYNLRGKAPEVMVDCKDWTLIRRPQHLEDLWRMFGGTQE